MNPNRTTALRRLDAQYLWHPFTPMRTWLADDQLVITAAQGMYLIDSDGKSYLDGVSSLWCNVHGHRVPEIDEAIRRQLDHVAHTTMLGLASEPAILLAEKLMPLLPRGLTKIFIATAARRRQKSPSKWRRNIGTTWGTERKISLSGSGMPTTAIP